MAVTALWRVALVSAALAAAGPAAAAAPPDLLGRWLDSVEQHRPGELDGPLIEAAGWSRAQVRELWRDIQVLFVVVDDPRKDTFSVVPLGQVRPVTVRPRGADRAALDTLAARVRRLGRPAVYTRAALLHTDVPLLAAELVPADGEAMSMHTPVIMSVGDGRPAGLELLSHHWDLARLMVEGVRLATPAAAFPRDWHRATLGLRQGVEQFDSNQLRHALRVVPDDAWLRLLQGAHHEAMAAPLFQQFARSFRQTQLRPDIRSEGAELSAAAAAYQHALRLDPAFVEARVRLGRVLGRQGRHAEGIEALSRALDEPAEALVHYYAALFLGLEHEALDDADAAVLAYSRAAELVPAAPMPQLALARLAQARGDRVAHVAQLDRALAPSLVRLDPWWSYRSSQARHAERWLSEVRAAAAASAP